MLTRISLHRPMAALSVAMWALGASLAAAQADRPVSVVAVPSTAQPFNDLLVLRGRTEADRRVEVRSETDGLIASAPIRKGALVREGDVLCELSEGVRGAELAEAEASLAEAMLNEDAARRLSEKGFTSTTQFNSMTAALERARAQVARANIDIDRLSIKAPFSGILETDTAELGSLLQNGSVCATLIALDPIKLVAFAPERSVDQLVAGATVSARLITGRQIEGAISFVSRSADRDTRTYLVEAEAPNPDLAIRDGMTAEIEVKLKGVKAHLVPQPALTLNRDGVLGVRLAVDGLAKFVPVEVLRDEPRGIWVSGLPDEAEIIVVGQEYVTNGQAIEVHHPEPERTQ